MEYSVLMSVYGKDNPKWLSEAIDSMLEQTIKTNDFVIVKDGPVSKEIDNILDKKEKEYGNIINIISLEKNVGLGPALKIGIESCKNELVARIDSDDYSVADRCEKQIKELINNPSIDIIGSNHIEFIDSIDNIVSIKKLPVEHKDIIKYARRRNPFSHSAVMYKKSKVLESGNYRSYYLCEDYDLWIRMIEHNAVCHNIDETLSYVRVNEDLYKRRGGIKYLKSLLKFKKEQYKNGFYSLNDYIVSSGSHIVVCLMPTFMRKIVYEKILRR